MKLSMGVDKMFHLAVSFDPLVYSVNYIGRKKHDICPFGHCIFL